MTYHWSKREVRVEVLRGCKQPVLMASWTRCLDRCHSLRLPRWLCLQLWHYHHDDGGTRVDSSVLDLASRCCRGSLMGCTCPHQVRDALVGPVGGGSVTAINPPDGLLMGWPNVVKLFRYFHQRPLTHINSQHRKCIILGHIVTGLLRPCDQAIKAWLWLRIGYAR